MAANWDDGFDYFAPLVPPQTGTTQSASYQYFMITLVITELRKEPQRRADHYGSFGHRPED